MGTGKGGSKVFDWNKWNLPFPSARTLRDDQPYETDDGILKTLMKASVDICKTPTVTPLLQTPRLRVIPIVLKSDGMTVKPGMKVDARRSAVVGTTQKIDIEYIKTHPKLDPDYLKNIFITEANVVAITSLDEKFSTPAGVHYKPSKGPGENMLSIILDYVRAL